MTNKELHVKKDCDRNHSYEPNKSSDNEEKKEKPTDEQIDAIVDRLYKTHTKSWKGEGPEESLKAEDTISKPVEDVHLMVHRLYNTPTKAMQDHHDQQLVAQDKISKGPLIGSALDNVVDRLFNTHTKSSSGGGKGVKVCNNSVAKKVESPDEIDEIFKRLQSTHTKSSAGGEDCRPWDSVKTPGSGLKMLPVIDGIEERFSGRGRTHSKEQLKELDQRMMTSQTKASQARLDNPRILLYPECTTLCNNVGRIRQFQESGAVATQPTLERREKWFN